MDFDHELLLSVASGLGRWSDGPDGAPVYTKDDDCVGAWGGGGGGGTDAVGKKNRASERRPAFETPRRSPLPCWAWGGRLSPLASARAGRWTHSVPRHAHAGGGKAMGPGRPARGRARPPHPTQGRWGARPPPPPAPPLSLTPLSPPLSSSLPQRLATLPPPGRPRHPPRLHPPGPLQPGQVGPGPTDDPVCGRRGHRHPRPCVFFGSCFFFCLHFFHARPRPPPFFPPRPRSRLSRPYLSLPSLFSQSRSPPS